MGGTTHIVCHALAPPRLDHKVACQGLGLGSNKCHSGQATQPSTLVNWRAGASGAGGRRKLGMKQRCTSRPCPQPHTLGASCGVRLQAHCTVHATSTPPHAWNAAAAAQHSGEMHAALVQPSTACPSPTCMGAGSSGRSAIERSSGSPGTICQWSKTDRQKAWPCRFGSEEGREVCHGRAERCCRGGTQAR